MTIFLILLWYFSGVASFIYWWTKTEDLTFGDLLFSLFIGLSGPMAFFIGVLAHGFSGGETIILIKKRKK